jgi:hypothetical protein
MRYPVPAPAPALAPVPVLAPVLVRVNTTFHLSQAA